MFEPEVAHIIRLDAVDRFVQSVDLVHRTVVVEQPQLVIGGVVGAALFAQFHPPQPVTAHVGTAYQRKIGTEFGDARVVAHVEPPVEQVERPRLTAQAGHGAEIGGIDARRQTALVDGEDPLVGSQQQLPLPAAGVVERTGRPLVVGMVIHPFAEQQQRKSPVERRPDILLRILRKRHHTVVEQPVFGRKNREQPSVGTGLVQSSEKRPEEIGAARGSDAAVEFVAPQPLRQRRTPRREPFAVVAPQSVGTRPHDPFALVRPGQQHPHGRRREAFAVGQPLEGLLPHPIERAAHLLHPELVARTQKKEHVHLARQAADALVIIKVDAVERLKQHPLRRDVDFPEIAVRKAGIALSRNERRIAQRTRSVAIPAPELLEPAREDHVVRQRGHRTHDRGAGQFVQPPLQAVEFEQPLVVAGIERSRIVFGHRPVLVGRPIIGRQQVDNAGTGGTRRHRRKHSGQETKQAVQELDRHKSLHGLGDKNRPFLRNIQTFARRNAPQRTGFSHDRSSPAPSDKR